MGRHYSTRDFFRQMPNALLGRYFAAHGALAGVDFAGMKEGQPEARLLHGWNCQRTSATRWMPSYARFTR